MTFQMKSKIAPMLLIPFVENAFKHGQLINGFLEVNIEIKLMDNQLEFSVTEYDIKR